MRPISYDQIANELDDGVSGVIWYVT
jgi:hypothetical protein